MTEDILNKIYAGFNKGYASFSITEIVEELYPKMSDDEKVDIANYIMSTRGEVNNYFYSRYNYKKDAINQDLQWEGYEWIRKKYPWMSEENIQYAISVAMYYAWHG